MAQFCVTFDHEFYEVLNAFPVLRQSLKELHIDTSSIVEGQSVGAVFVKMNLSENEANILLRKVNEHLSLFLKDSDAFKNRFVNTDDFSEKSDDSSLDLIMIEEE